MNTMDYLYETNQTGTPVIYEFTVDLRTIDGYTPKNKKCFCYPYNQICLYTNKGDKLVFKPELFDKLNDEQFKIQIAYKYVFSAVPKVYAYCIDYNRQENYYRESITFADFPNIPVIMDTYKNWFALHKNSLAVSLIRKVEDMAVGIGGAIAGANAGVGAVNAINSNQILLDSEEGKALLGQINKAEKQVNSGMGSASSASRSIVDQIAFMEDMKKIPNTVSCIPQGDELIFTGAVGIYVSQETCKLEYIHVIDDYFTRFGYQINETFEPVFNNRKSFDYLQTTGINITGKRKQPTSQEDFSRYNIPNEDILELNAMFDNGLTIWHNETTYGDYNVDNSPRTL